MHALAFWISEPGEQSTAQVEEGKGQGRHLYLRGRSPASVATLFSVIFRRKEERNGGMFGKILWIVELGSGCVRGTADLMTDFLMRYMQQFRSNLKKTLRITVRALKRRLASLLWYLKRFQFPSNLSDFKWNWEINQIVGDVNHNYYLARLLLTPLPPYDIHWFTVSSHFSSQ